MKISSRNNNVWIVFVAIIVLVVFLTVMMPNAATRMMGMNRSNVTRRYMTMPELQQNMTQIGRAYKRQRGMKL